MNRCLIRKSRKFPKLVCLCSSSPVWCARSAVPFDVRVLPICVIVCVCAMCTMISDIQLAGVCNSAFASLRHTHIQFMWPFEISSLRRLRNKKEINKLKLSGHRHRRHRQNCEIRIIHSKQFQFVCILLEVGHGQPATYGFVDVDEMIICFPIVCYLFLVKSS